MSNRIGFEISGDYTGSIPEKGSKIIMSCSTGEEKELVLTQKPYLDHAGNTVLKTLDRESILRKSPYSVFRKVRMFRDVQSLYHYCKLMRYF